MTALSCLSSEDSGDTGGEGQPDGNNLLTYCITGIPLILRKGHNLNQNLLIPKQTSTYNVQTHDDVVTELDLGKG